jgi:hypothetical protein
MVFNATFSNASAISWRLVLLVEETGVPEENHRPGMLLSKLLFRLYYSICDLSELICLFAENNVCNRFRFTPLKKFIYCYNNWIVLTI